MLFVLFVVSAADLPTIHRLMSSYDASLNEWRRFEFWDKTKKYTRNLIATDNQTFTLMLLCWNPQQGSPIHDHAGSECFMRCIEGEICETQYEVPTPESSLKVRAQRTYHAGEVAFINDSIGLHAVDNRSSSHAVTLHCYLPPYQECKTFEEDGKYNKSYVTFYSEQGEKVEE